MAKICNKCEKVHSGVCQPGTVFGESRLRQKGNDMKTLKEIVKELEQRLHCNCDLDNFQPQVDTGHSFICRIDTSAREIYRNQLNLAERNGMKIRTFEGVGQMAQGELHRYRDGNPVISIGRSKWTDSPPLGWIESSPSFTEFPADQWDAKLSEYRKANTSDERRM